MVVGASEFSAIVAKTGTSVAVGAARAYVAAQWPVIEGYDASVTSAA